MTAAFAERDKQHLLHDLMQWYAPATVASRSAGGRRQREKRQDHAQRVFDAFMVAADEGRDMQTRDAAINAVGSVLYPLLWSILRPLLWRAIAEIATWLYNRTR